MGCGGSKAEPDPKGQHDEDTLPKKYELNEGSLEDFLSCEKDAKIYLERHVVETLKVRMDQKEQLEKSVKRMEGEHQKLKEEIHRNKMNGQLHKGGKSPGEERPVKTYLMDQESYDEHTAYEKADYISLLNRMEMSKKEISGTRQHIVELKNECEMLSEDVDDYIDICDMRNKILGTLFNGAYGSHKESQLEEELEYLFLQLQLYEGVNFKWRQAHVMVEYACKQIGTAVCKWEEIKKSPPKPMEPRYRLAEETRNNLIAAGQNLQGSHRYLPEVKFPYCSAEEVSMLNKATSYVFTDMQAEVRQEHALDCYIAAHRRSGALLQWFNDTINNIIMSSLRKVKERVKVVDKELRIERVQLIIQLMKSRYNKHIDISAIDVELENENSGLAYELMAEEDKLRDQSGHSVTMRGSYVNLDYSNVENAPSPLPKSELAPLLSKEQLYGPMEELKSHFKDSNMNKKNEAMGNGKPGQRRNRKPGWMRERERIKEEDRKERQRKEDERIFGPQKNGPHKNGPHQKVDGHHHDDKHHNQHDNNHHDNKHHNQHDNNHHDNKHHNQHDNKHQNQYENNHHNQYDNKHHRRNSIRHPNQVLDIEDVDEEDGHHIANNVKKKFDQHASDRYASDRHAPDRHAPDRHAPDRHAPDRHAPDRHAPDRYASDRHAPDRHAVERY